MKHLVGLKSLVDFVRMLRDPRTPKSAKIVSLIGVLYTLWPIDVLPDVIPVIGWVDDFTMVALSLAIASTLIPRIVKQDVRQESKVITVTNP
jgi:uncharacterized membrane protein YkvA (DUF1232 family)